MTVEEIGAHIQSLGEPAFRAGQIFKWLQAGVHSFSDMTNLPLKLRERLEGIFFINSCKIKKKLVSSRDDTVKYLYELNDGETVESVVMRYKHGNSVCISSQVGCRMGCGFCATALGGFTRNLSASEMLSQITGAMQDLSLPISHVVLMGMGEPLDNLEQLKRFLLLVSHPEGLGISKRHISVSTCGIVDGIYELMKDKPQFTLSVSLHAPNDEIRDKLMPINRRWNVDSLLAACTEYSKQTGRRISFEYALIKGVNDSDACAYELAGKLRGMLAHVNLIPMNNVKETGFTQSARSRIDSFHRVLTNQNINVTIRRTLGADINASCGQLRNNHSGQGGEA